MTRWSPDTCGCVIEYDENINVVAVINKCPKHAGTDSNAVHLATVLAHNRKKNAVHNAVVDHTKSIGADPSMVQTLYDAQDNLIVANSGLSAAEQQKAIGTVALGTSVLIFRG